MVTNCSIELEKKFLIDNVKVPSVWKYKVSLRHNMTNVDVKCVTMQIKNFLPFYEITHTFETSDEVLLFIERIKSIVELNNRNCDFLNSCRSFPQDARLVKLTLYVRDADCTKCLVSLDNKNEDK